MNSTTNNWKAAPSLLTYGGGSRSRRNGIFAGVTDIQGMDMYVQIATISQRFILLLGYRKSHKLESTLRINYVHEQ